MWHALSPVSGNETSPSDGTCICLGMYVRVVSYTVDATLRIIKKKRLEKIRDEDTKDVSSTETRVLGQDDRGKKNASRSDQILKKATSRSESCTDWPADK